MNGKICQVLTEDEETIQPTNTSTQQREAIAAAEVYEGSAKTEQNKEDN